MICSLNEFIWIWDELQKLSVPKHHRKMGRFLEMLSVRAQNGLLMSFRGSGKSTLVGLFGAWILLNKPETRVLILSADYALARKMVSHIRRIIESHPLTKGLKPQNPAEWASDRFTVCRETGMRDPSVLAMGLNANITGCRADVIICDDVEVPRTSDTADKRELLRQKLGELDFVLSSGGYMLYIGTPHTSETIYNTAVGGFLSGWQALKIPLILQNGQSAWPEKFPLSRIEKLRIRSGPNKFRSQMMLEPVSLGDSRLNPKRLRFYTEELSYREANGQGLLYLGQTRLTGVSCWWDPSFGSVRGDKSVVACVFFDEDGSAYLHHLMYLTVPPDTEATAWQCAKVRDLVKDSYIPAIHLETNGIGKFLPALLRQDLARQRIPCAVLEETARQNKTMRILSAFEAPLMNGNLWVHTSIRQTPFLGEMQDFAPGRTSHDDGLDAVAGCLLAEPVRLKRPLWQNKKQNLEWRF